MKKLLLLAFWGWCAISRAQTYFAPPAAQPRAMAEWEESEAVIITWTYYNNNNIRTILREIVREVREVADVIIICSDSTAVKSHLQNNGIDVSSRIKYIHTGFNTLWVRDYGPHTVYFNEVGDRALVDWIYNRPRPLDDASPVSVAQHVGVPIYRTMTAPYDLVHTGGNFMADGLGTAFSSKLVLDENAPGSTYTITGWNEAGVDNLMYLFMGIERYIKMDNLPYDGIHHIDMHMKLLDESTLLVGEYPTGISDGPQIEANIQYVLSNFTDPWGKPYRIVRIPMPPEGNQWPSNGGDYRTYTNALIVNSKVLVPTYVQQYDTTALRIWQEAMPGYEIVGINSLAIIPFSGAIHCITHELGAADPLLIVHSRLDNQTFTSYLYPVEAKINHKTGISSAQVFYRLKGETDYQSLPMTQVGSSDKWIAFIPQQPQDTFVQYYIRATANNGKVQTRPMPAPEGYWQFYIEKNPTDVDDRMSLLSPPFPNPASAITCVPIETVRPGQATIVLTDVLGRRVETLHDGWLSAGPHKFFFNAAHKTPGVYFIQLSDGIGTQTMKIMVR